MNEHSIDLFDISKLLWKKKRVATKKCAANIGIILSEFERVLSQRFLPKSSDDKKKGKKKVENYKFYIGAGSPEYHNVLSLQLLLIDPALIYDVLNYHLYKYPAKNENGVDFKFFIEKSVTPAVKVNASFIGIKKTNLNIILENIQFFLDEPVRTNHAKIYFDFHNKKEKDSIIQALKPYVEEGYRCYLNDFLSENIPKQRVKFIVVANIVVELFSRFMKFRIIPEEYSRRQVCIWLSERCIFKAQRKTTYLIMKHTTLQNIFMEQNCGVIKKERLLPDLRKP